MGILASNKIKIYSGCQQGGPYEITKACGKNCDFYNEKKLKKRKKTGNQPKKATFSWKVIDDKNDARRNVRHRE